MKDLNELRDKAYQCAVVHGWHDEYLSDEHFLCLVISELMEAVEADRKGKYANRDKFEYYMKQRERDVGEFMYAFKCDIKDTVEDELADACIRLLDLAGLRKINLSDISFPIYNSDDHKNSRKSLTFTEWVYDVTRVISGFNKNNYPIGYLFVGILQEICCKAELIGFDMLWHIDQKMKYNELRPYKHGGKTY
jgi:hypothetical protein